MGPEVDSCLVSGEQKVPYILPSGAAGRTPLPCDLVDAPRHGTVTPELASSHLLRPTLSSPRLEAEEEEFGERQNKI